MTARAARRATRRVGAPAVVFLDDLRWDAFMQLSPRLRRAGVRTIRISTEAHSRSKMASRLLFDRHLVLSAGSERDELRAALVAEHVVDVQFVETLGHLVRDQLDVLDADVAARVGARLAITDKLDAARRFAAAGVRTPAVTAAADTTPSEVAEALGLPAVAKRRVGCGGDSVVIARDLATLFSAAASWDGVDEGYYEQFIDGEKLNYAAAVSDAGIEQELAYRVTRWMQPVGTATEIVTIDDPALMALGRRALEVAGCTGLMNLDVMRDRAGTDWLIDCNARAFGGGANFLTVGLDVSEGYLRSLGLREDAVTSRAPPTGTLIEVFPTSLGDARNKGSLLRMAVAFLGDGLPYARWLGVRYWLSEAIRIPDGLASWRRARRATAP